MKKAARQTDKSTANAPAVGCSNNVFVNNLGWVRKGDFFSAPCNNVSTGSSNSVFANGIGVCRVADTLACSGQTIRDGSNDTFAGD